MGYVYLITNTINGKQYVGKTIKSVKERLDRHISIAKRGSNLHLHNAIRKYGEEAFKIEILDESDNEDDLFLLEFHWITYLGTQVDGYNMTAGGEGISGYTYSHTQEAKDKIKTKLTGRKHSIEATVRIEEAMRGKFKSEEHKQKISEAVKSYWKKKRDNES